MNTKSIFYRTFAHFYTITKHKMIVTRLCFKMGLYKQGLLHDLSKYTPVEFFSGVRYYQATRSPNDAEKEKYGYSLSWLHHKGRNKHHWEYWIDRTREGIISGKVPVNYIKESVCDRIAACMTYQKEEYTDASAYTYFTKGSDQHLMHKESAKKMLIYLELVKEMGIDKAFIIIKNDK